MKAIINREKSEVIGHSIPAETNGRAGVPVKAGEEILFCIQAGRY